MSNETSQPKKKRKMLTSFSIILILLAIVALITIAMNGFSALNGEGEVVASITGANLGQFMMAPVKGFNDAVDVCLFILVLGGFLGIVTKTDALNVGIANLVKKMGGNELKLIPILMFLFAVLGTSYGFCEESVAFYALLAATMMAAGFDALTGAAMILLGAAAGVLGSTVNPFATGIASSSADAAFKTLGINAEVNQAYVIILGLILMLVSWGICTFFVVQYAKKVRKDPASTAMTADELKAAQETYGDAAEASKNVKDLTGRQKAVLWVFAAAFVIMILGFIPWEKLGVGFFNAGYTDHNVATIYESGNKVVLPEGFHFDSEGNLVGDDIIVQKKDITIVPFSEVANDTKIMVGEDEVQVANDAQIDGVTISTQEDSAGWSAFLTNVPLGEWYFAESTTWFLLLAIITGIVGGLDEHEIVNEFMAGAGEMIAVVMIVALSRGVSVLMSETGLSNYFLYTTSSALQGTSGVVLTIGSYLLFFVLSFLIPSSSGLATVSMPIMAPLAAQLSLDPAVMVMIFSAASGAVNMITPTNGAIMGGLALARVEYGTWFKFALKIVLLTALASIIVLVGASLILV